MDWKQSFNPTILEEGYLLYTHQCCEPIQVRNPFYEGFIEDPSKSSHYFVRAKLEDNEIISIHCSCPQGQKGELCIHEAAFLFALEKQLLYQPKNTVFSHPQSSSAQSFNHTLLDSWLNGSSSLLKASPQKNEVVQKTNSSSSSLSSHEVEEFWQAVNQLTGKKPTSTAKPSTSWQNPLFKNQKGEEESTPENLLTKDSLSKLSSSFQEKKKTSSSLSSKELNDLWEGLAHLTGKPYEAIQKRHSDSSLTDEKDKVKEVTKKSFPKQVDSALFNPSLNEKNPFVKLSQTGSSTSSQSTLKTQEVIPPKAGLRDLIASLSRQELERLILKEALNDLDFRLRLELTLLQEVPEDVLTLYCTWLDETIYKAKRDSQKNPSLTVDVAYPYLKEKIEILLDHNQIELAFSFLSYAISTFDQAHLSFNSKIEKDLVSWGSTIITKANSALESEIFSWLEVELEKPYQDFDLHQALLKLFSTFFSQEQYILPKFEQLKDEFLIYENQSHKEAQRVLKILIEALDKLGESHPDLYENDPAFKDRLESKPYFWDLQMDKALAHHDHQSARIICERLIRLYPKNSFSQAQHIRNLISLLSLEGKEDQAKQTLIDFITNNPHLLPKDLKALSQKVDEETYKGALTALKNKVAPYILAEAYFENGQKEELMTWIEESQDLLLAAQYEKALKEKYASRLATLWEKEAKRKADTKNVANYQDVATALNTIARLPGHHQKAQELAKAIHETYPHKLALFHRIQETGLLEENSFD